MFGGSEEHVPDWNDKLSRNDRSMVTVDPAHGMCDGLYADVALAQRAQGL